MRGNQSILVFESAGLSPNLSCADRAAKALLLSPTATSPLPFISIQKPPGLPLLWF
jgi:hypothetical protein